MAFRGKRAVREYSILLVNHCHPETPHVCGLRFRRFAESLARFGHRTLLLVEGSDSLGASPPPELVRRQLHEHDWGTPFILSCLPAASPLLSRARNGALPTLVGKACLAGHFALFGGQFTDWVNGSRPYWHIVAEDFKPDVTWATFGNTGAWIIAQNIAALRGCPWGMDFKDNWSAFVPTPFRSRLPSRFKNASFATALSATHAVDARRWFDRNAEVIYSGISDDLISEPTQPVGSEGLRILVAGGLYEERHLALLFDGIAGWLDEFRRQDPVRPVSIAYFGSESERFKRAAQRFNGMCGIETPGYVPLSRLFDEMCRATVNIYLRSPQVHFHHKIFEYLAADRPAICVPGEGAEAESIISDVGGRFFSCGDASDIISALSLICREPAKPAGISNAKLREFRWDSQARVAEKALASAITEWAP
jgi:hypothetical protein